jgi:2-dehydro-3-deoxygluconokinase
MTVEIVTIGEVMLRLSVRSGDRLDSAPTFEVHVGGAEANTAAALAALGRSVAWVSVLPDNSLGRRVAAALRSLDVDIESVRWAEGARLGTFFVELSEPPRPIRVLYDRSGSAASSMTPADVPWQRIDQSRLVHVSGITPALSPSCRTAVTELADRLRQSKVAFAVDVNYRAQLWSALEARRCLEEVAAGADVVVCTAEDARDVFDIEESPEHAASALADRLGAGRLVITDGPEGAWWREGTSSGHVPAIPATVVDRLGAGDAFTAGVIDGVLDGDLEAGVRRGVALGALALGTRGDQVRTSRAEVENLLRGEDRHIDR